MPPCSVLRVQYLGFAVAKTLVLGCCSTGAKYTPLNHRATGDALMDRICTGADIPVAFHQVRAELEQLDALGVRYYHYHARNPDTAEQTTDNAVYRAVGLLARRTAPHMMLSYGASRNGSEVMHRIGQLGEWERVSHAGWRWRKAARTSSPCRQPSSCRSCGTWSGKPRP